MTKNLKIVDEMVDYARQLRLHTKGRRAIHLKLSALEKHYRDERYRRFVASILRPLIVKHGATMFALPTNDLVLVVQNVGVDQIDTLLNHARRKFKDSDLISSLDPVQGVSDAFVEWFDLKEDYKGFRTYIETLADDIANIITGAKKAISEKKDKSPAEKTAAGKVKPSSSAGKSAPVTEKKLRMVPISAPEKNIEAHAFDPDLLVALSNALATVDVAGMMRKQRVMAMVDNAPARSVMVHRFIPRSVVFEKLFEAQVVGHNHWLAGYFMDLLATRALVSPPNMQNEHSLASSLQVTSANVCDSVFDQFDRSVGSQPRSTIILEFSITDVLANFGSYKMARQKIDPAGYRISIGDIDPHTLLWLDYQKFGTDFVKLKVPKEAEASWLTPELEAELRTKIAEIGIARVILDGCKSPGDLEMGKRLGITLFQGSAAAPVTQ